MSTYNWILNLDYSIQPIGAQYQSALNLIDSLPIMKFFKLLHTNSSNQANSFEVKIPCTFGLDVKAGIQYLFDSFKKNNSISSYAIELERIDTI